MDQKQSRQKELYRKAHGSQKMTELAAVPRGKHKKFHRVWQGPFVIKKKISDVLYQIQQEKSSRKQIVHFDRLKPCWTRQSEDNQEPMRQSEDNQEPIVHHHTDEDYHIYIEPDATSSDPDTSSDETESSEESSSQQSSTPALRRSTRTRRPPPRYKDYVSH